jgi:uncharacterized protein (TIGR03382 family)
MKLGVAVITALLLATGTVQAAKRNYSGELRPRNEVTAPDLTRDAGGRNFRPYGEIEATYDDVTKELCGRFVRFTDLSGPATGMHIHEAPMNQPEADGPADRKLIIPPGAPPVLFNVKLDTAFETALVKGEVYANVHTDKNPKGEMRGTLYAFDFGEEITCPAPTQPPTTTPDGGTPPTGSDGGTTPPSNTDGTSAPSDTSDTSQPPPDTTTPSKDPPAAPAKEGGCNTAGATGGLPVLVLALLGFAGARRRARRN